MQLIRNKEEQIINKLIITDNLITENIIIDN
jgi:hypothetical protein